MKNFALCMLCILLCGCASLTGTQTQPDMQPAVAVEIGVDGRWNFTRDTLTQSLNLTEANWNPIPSEYEETYASEYHSNPDAYLSPSVTAYCDADSGSLSSVSVAFSLEGETAANYAEFRTYFAGICALLFPELSADEINTLRQDLRQSAENQSSFQYQNSVAVCTAEEAAGTIIIIFCPSKNPD